MTEPVTFTLRQLSYFVAAAEFGSLTAAAGAVHLSQSAMSNAIAELERAMGVQLLVRHHARGLFLTSAGEVMLHRAKKLLDEAEAIASDVRSDERQLFGRLRLGAYPTLVPTLGPTIVAEFMTAHPGVAIELVEGTSVELTEMLRRGSCELALVYDIDVPSDIHVTTLGVLRSYVLLSRDHELASSDTADLRKLSDTPLILLDLPPSGRYFADILDAAGVTSPIAFRSSSVEVVRGLVSRNLGYTILTQPGYARGLGTENLVALPIKQRIDAVPVVVIRLDAVKPTRRAQALEEICQAHVPEMLKA